MGHKSSLKSTRQINRLAVIDLVWFLRSLPDEERKQAIELLRAIQDRHWHEIWPEPLILGENG